MPRRYDNSPYIDELPIPEELPIKGYVQHPMADESPWAALLWTDLRRSMRKAKLTPLQQCVFEAHLYKMSQREIADAMHRSRSTIKDALGAALSKIDTSKCGLITVIVEEFGIRGLDFIDW